MAFAVGDWKIVFQEQRAKTMQLWAEPFVELRVPKIFNLRRDPFERADENSNTYWDWVLDHIFMPLSGPAHRGRPASDPVFLEFRRVRNPPSFNLDRVFGKAAGRGTAAAALMCVHEVCASASTTILSEHG